MRKHYLPLASLILFGSSSTSRLQPAVVVVVDAASSIATLDLDCMCGAYDASSERNGSPVDSDGSSCTDGFQTMVDFYAPPDPDDSAAADKTCAERLDELPADFCGFPNGHDPDPDGGSVCSAAATGRGECEFELFSATIPCEWSNRRACSWHEGACSDSVSDWFRMTYGISSSTNDCSAQQNPSDCIGTDVLGAHCMSYGLFDGEDVDLTCPTQQDQSSCSSASYVADRACLWHEAIEVGRATTFVDCCDVPYEPPYAGSRWCSPIDMSYVPDGRVSSGIARGAAPPPSPAYYTCDEIAGTYVYGIQSRGVLTSEYGQGPVDLVDANCCVPHPPTAGPTVAAPSASPTETTPPSPGPTPAPSLSLRPSDNPSAAPPAPSDAPTAAVTTEPSPSTPTPMTGSESNLENISNREADVDGGGGGGGAKTVGFVLVMAGCPALLAMFGCFLYHKEKSRHGKLQAQRAVTDDELDSYEGA